MCETGVSTGETQSSPSTPGIESLLGVVRLRVLRSDATFEIGQYHRLWCDIRAHGAVIGRGSDADVRLTGPAANEMSRRHLLISTLGRQWIAADVGATHGTFEVGRDGSWSRIPIDVPIPVEDGMLLCLGPRLILQLEVNVQTAAGDTTPRAAGGAARRAQRIRPAELEQVAIALLEPRRLDPRDRSVPSADELRRRLHLSRATVYRRLGDLRALDAVGRLLSSERTVLADALAAAYPYLVQSTPG